MKRSRIFIAINLPKDLKVELAAFESKWPDFPARWTKKDNIHITLAFIGYVNPEELYYISKTAKEVAARNSPFTVKLSKVCYGPVDKIPPRMIWAIGEKSKEFTDLRGDLEKTLFDSGKINFSPEKREFSPHITLARIIQWGWNRIEPEERPAIEEDINLTFPVDSIEVMESVLRPGGAEYTILESHDLGK